MRARRASVLASPLLVGAATILAAIVGVMLAYNANNGLPFVPTVELKTVVPSGAKLVQGNEVREGGYRIGIVSEIESLRLADGSAGAELTLKLDQKAAPIPADSSVRVRPRSALGLKYVELERGSAADTLEDGATIVSASADALAPELQEFFDVFDQRGYLLKIDALINECTDYTDAEEAKANPERYQRCGQPLGPTQPGINTPDPSPPAAGDEQLLDYLFAP